jgi:hypothetical protein
VDVLGHESLLAVFCCLSQTRKMLVVADGRSLPSILQEFLLIGRPRPVDIAALR